MRSGSGCGRAGKWYCGRWGCCRGCLVWNLGLDLDLGWQVGAWGSLYVEDGESLEDVAAVVAVVEDGLGVAIGSWL